MCLVISRGQKGTALIVFDIYWETEAKLLRAATEGPNVSSLPVTGFIGGKILLSSQNCVSLHQILC